MDDGRDEVERSRSLSTMARFAAADPQVTGVLATIVESLGRLEKRMAALEKGRDVPVGTTPVEPPEEKGKKKRKKRKKSVTASETTVRSAPRPTPKKRRASEPAVSFRAGPSDQTAKKNTPRKATPRQTESSQDLVPLVDFDSWERVERKGKKHVKKKDGEGKGVAPPQPARRGSVARKQPPQAPTKAVAAVRPAEQPAARRRRTPVDKGTASGKIGPAVPADQSIRKRRRRVRAALRRRLPRSAAVGLTAVPGPDGEAPTLADIVRKARTAVSDLNAMFGIRSMRSRRMASGGMLLQIPGVEASQKADALANRLQEVLAEVPGVRITRPVRRADLRITGFDDSVTPQEIAEAISDFGAKCTTQDVRVGIIRTSRNGLCTVWVQAPTVVAVPAAEAEKVKLGWTTARVTLLKGRLLSLSCPRPRDAAVPLPGGPIAPLL